MQAFEHEVAVSAVQYDALLVADIMARLQPSLGDHVVWTGRAIADESSPSSVPGANARVMLVIMHPLWSREPATAADSGMLRRRMQRRPKSVIVLAVDEVAVPSWLGKARVHRLRADGLTAVVDTILAVVAKQGGCVNEVVAEAIEKAPASPRFSLDALPFLEQSRAQNTLRRELDQLLSAVASRIDRDVAGDDGTIREVCAFPNRIIARRGHLAISFSWLGGRLGGIADGRLLVIEWSGLSGTERGAGALKSAVASRETSYHPEASDAASWCWRADSAQGRPCSTVDLVGEWYEGASLALTE